MSRPAGPPRAATCLVWRTGNHLRIEGEIDQANASAITVRIVAEVRTGVTHLDFSGVTYCGAAGVRAVLAARAAQSAERAGLVVICAPTLFRILHITGVAAVDGVVVLPTPHPDGQRSKGER